MEQDRLGVPSEGLRAGVAEGAPARGGRLLFNVNLLFLTQVASYGLRFLAGVLLARGLGPEGRGDYALFILSTSMAASLATMGVGLGSMYHIGKDRYSVRILLGNSQFVVLVAAALGLLVTISVGLAVDTSAFVSGDVFWLYVVALPAVLEYLLLAPLLVGQGRFAGLNLATLTQVGLVAAGALALYLADEFTLLSIISVWCGSYVAASFVAVAFLGFENWSLRATIRPDSAALRNQIGTGLPGQAGNVVQFLNYRLDQFVLRGLSSRANVGIYAVAVGMSETVWWIANSVALALLPRLTRMDTERGAEVTSVACRNTLLIALVAAGGLAAVSPLAVRLLFGGAFSDASFAILLLMPGTVAMSGAKIILSYMFSQGRMVASSLIAVVALGGTVLLDLVLIPRFGIPGAAAASSIAYSISFALTLAYYQRMTGNSFLACLFIRVADVELYLDLVRRARRRVSGRTLAERGSSG